MLNSDMCLAYDNNEEHALCMKEEEKKGNKKPNKACKSL